MSGATGATGASAYRIEYHRFAGAHEDHVFASLGRAVRAVRDELNALAAGQGPHGAPWRRVHAPEGVDMTDVEQCYEHVSWSKHKPERILIVRVRP